MVRQYISSDGGLINETGARQYVGPGGVVNETSSSSGTTIAALVGDGAAAGSTAAITAGGATTITCAVGDAAAAGAAASVSTKIVTSILMNNTQSIHATQAVSWSWFPGGRIGAMAAITPVDGTGTTGADGRYVSSITRAAGVLMVAVQVTGPTDDDVYYEAFS